jgi:hypothetical protein
MQRVDRTTPRAVPNPIAFGLVTAAAAALVAGCMGDIGGDGPGSTPPGGTLACPGDVAPPVTAARVRRFTRTEFDRSVSALLGEDLRMSGDFPPDTTSAGYTNQADVLEVNSVLADALHAAAEKLARLAVDKLSALAPCAADADDACARRFISDFAGRAYRRPLTAEEEASLFSVYEVGKEGADFAAGIGLMLEVVFQSPNFLYKTELGPASADGTRGKLRLTPREIATELAYLVTGGPPDDALAKAADGGDLSTADGREQEARRLLRHPWAMKQMSTFFFQWIGIDKVEQLSKDEGAFPGFDGGLAAKLREETEAFVQHVAFHGDGKLETLLTAAYTFADADIARLYGVDLPKGSPFVRIDLDPRQRSGLLTQPSVLATFAHVDQDSPVRRGKFVYTRLFCKDIPSPPKTVDTTPPRPDTHTTTRARYEAHLTDDTCRACHQYMDPIGFGFENYDGIGRFRTRENGYPIDASGRLTNTDSDGTFEGAVELGEILADSAEVRACFTQQWFQYAMARSAEPAETCSIRAAFDDFLQGKGRISDVVIQIARSEAFVERAAQP